MKSTLLAVLALLVTASSLSAEVYVKHHTHTDAYYYGGATTPEVDRDFEIWVGEGKYALVQEQVKWLFDVSNNTLTFVHVGDSIYFQTTLPPQWENIIVEEEVGRIQMYQYTGEIKEQGKVKEIDGRKCTEHKLTTWIPYQDIKYNETDEVTWYTKDIPIDFDIFNKVYPYLLVLRNYNTELIETIGVPDGYPVRSEETRFQKGLEINTMIEVKEISEKDAPEGFWAAPEGFTIKDRLTIQELQGN